MDNELENSACKRPHLGNNTNLVHRRDNDVAEPEVLGMLEFPELLDSVPVEVGSNIAACSQVRDSNNESLLQSELVSTEIMALYTEGENKLRKALKDVLLEDHDWCLKLFDRHGKAIVILHCLECKKDLGGTEGLHSKDKVLNLFSNFVKSHIMSNQHIRSWCLCKGLDWYNHPQSIAKGKKIIFLTNEDHKPLVLEGV